MKPRNIRPASPGQQIDAGGRLKASKKKPTSASVSIAMVVALFQRQMTYRNIPRSPQSRPRGRPETSMMLSAFVIPDEQSRVSTAASHSGRKAAESRCRLHQDGGGDDLANQRTPGDRTLRSSNKPSMTTIDPAKKPGHPPRELIREGQREQETPNRWRCRPGKPPGRDGF